MPFGSSIVDSGAHDLLNRKGRQVHSSQKPQRRRIY